MIYSIQPLKQLSQPFISGHLFKSVSRSFIFLFFVGCVIYYLMIQSIGVSRFLYSYLSSSLNLGLLSYFTTFTLPLITSMFVRTWCFKQILGLLQAFLVIKLQDVVASNLLLDSNPLQLP
jgi:hypothetical protein